MCYNNNTEREVNKMTNTEKADLILSYVAQNIISPLAFDDRKASEVWEEMIKDPFNKFCKFVKETLDK